MSDEARERRRSPALKTLSAKSQCAIKRMTPVSQFSDVADIVRVRTADLLRLRSPQTDATKRLGLLHRLGHQFVTLLLACRARLRSAAVRSSENTVS